MNLKHKNRIVAVAKAEAESKKLQGQGIADQRREIAKGLEESVRMLNNVIFSRSICVNRSDTAL
jgi:hypothetical protein